MLSAGGHDVVAITSSPSKSDYIKGLVAGHHKGGGPGELTVVVANDDPRFSKAVLASGGPADLVVENVGAPTMEQSLRSLKSGGKIVLIGNVTNSTFELPLGMCIVKSLSVIGTDSCEAGEVQKMMAWMQENNLKPSIDVVLPLNEAAAAHEMVEARRIEGRVVLRVAGDGDTWDTNLPHLP